MKSYRKHSAALLAIACLSITLIQFSPASRIDASSGSTIRTENWETITLSEKVSIQASGRGNPWVNLSDGRAVIAGYRGPSELVGLLERNEAKPLTLASADFNEDGVPDLVSGYAAGEGGIITLLRGNVDTIYPHTAEANKRRAEGTFTDSPFLGPVKVFSAPESADFLGAGDFDADGHWDVVIARRGSKQLHILAGDGRGSLSAGMPIDVNGAVTAMAVGEINRRDGLDDIVVGVAAADGPKALVFQGLAGAQKARPEVFSLPAEATSLALGQLDESYEIDLAIASGHELLIVRGLDRTPSFARSMTQAPVERISKMRFASKLKAIASGKFIVGHRSAIAALTADGAIALVSQSEMTVTTGDRNRSWQSVRVSGKWPSTEQLLKARVSCSAEDDLLMLDATSRKVRIVRGSQRSIDQNSSLAFQSSPNGELVELDLDGAPAAVIPMRLNGDAVSDLVVLKKGGATPAVTLSAPVNTYDVTNTDDSGPGSLRKAIDDANGSPGLDTINFSIGSGTKTISPMSALPDITDSVTIDGFTQPPAAGAPIIELSGASAGADVKALILMASNCAIKGLVINRFTSKGIQVEPPGGNNIFEGNYIGLNVSGNADLGNGVQGIQIRTADNVIGGTVSTARNVISGNDAAGILIRDATATDNLVQGNYIGTNDNGTGAIGNTFEGVGVRESAENNIIGGTTDGMRNIISGNLRHGVFVCLGATGTLVQGNRIGTDKTGLLAVGNGRHGVSVSNSLDNTIGGPTASARNIISANNINGVSVGIAEDEVPGGGQGITISNNYIGTDVNGTGDLGNTRDGIFLDADSFDNTIENNLIAFNGDNGVHLPNTGKSTPAFQINIRSNSIHTNSLLGIELGAAGVTANDFGDSDVGPNNQQNFPVLTSVTSLNGVTRIIGALNAAPNTNYWVEFFSSPECTDSNPGQGQTQIGSALIFRTGGNGTAAIDMTFNNTPVSGFVNATATDPQDNTSEFSCVMVNGSAGCSYSLNSTAQSFSSSGGTGSITVTANCSWNAISNASFITFTSAVDGNGNGTVGYEVAANTTVSPRSGTMTIADIVFTVTQDPSAPCSFMLSETEQSFLATGGGGNFSVTTQAGCSWYPMTDVGWVSATRSGATVNYFVGSNNSIARTAHITVQDQVYTITQNAGSAVCSYMVSPTSAPFTSAGGEDSFALTTGTSCTWNAGANVSWISLPDGGEGGGDVNYTVDPNTGPARTGSIFIQGQQNSVQITVTQSAGCTFTLSEPSKSFNATGGGGSVMVTAGAGCTWQVNNNNPALITLTSPNIGTGSSTVTYTVELNAGLASRSGSLTIAGQTYSVVQGAMFNDVPPSHLFYDDIGKLSARGITVGCGQGNFCPNDFVTREQMAAFIVRSLGEFNPPTPASQRFEDVPPSNTFYSFIDRLAALLITGGCTSPPAPLRYCPGSNVTREQMAAFLIRGLGEFNPPEPPTQHFVDVPPSNIFYRFIDRMNVLNITSGCQTSPPLYCPSNNVTRGEMAKFLVRAFDL